jgi:hypothetical protein
VSRWREAIGVDPTRGPLLIRYRLLETRWGSCYLHHLLRSDGDRDLHDHPWAFASWLLWGSYVEHRRRPTMTERAIGRLLGPVVVQRRRWGSLAWRRATDAHRLELRRPAWSLLWVTPRVRTWGFYTPGGWVAHSYYRGERT